MDDFPTASTPTYCTAAQVFQVLQEAVPSAHSDVGEMSKSDVEERIMEAEDDVDRLTGQAWRERLVTEEYLDIDRDLIDEEGFALIDLGKIHIKDFDGGQGDKIEVWQGNAFVDWVATKTSGRNNDYHVVKDAGELYIRLGAHGTTSLAHLGSPRNRVRVTYRYGLSTVPHAIRSATRLLVAVDMLQGTEFGEHGRGDGVDRINLESRAQRLERQAHQKLARYRIGRFA